MIINNKQRRNKNYNNNRFHKMRKVAAKIMKIKYFMRDRDLKIKINIRNKMM